MAHGHQKHSRGRASTVATRAYRLLNKPYYWYRPAQLASRIHTRAATDGHLQLLRTAWGSRLYCWPDAIGLAIARTGVYELIVAETLARLADAGEVAIDAGANVGFMSNVLAHAVAPTGGVISFEPHPANVEVLGKNASRWLEVERLCRVEVRAAALSSLPGRLALAVDPARFEGNRGIASVERRDRPNWVHIDIQATRLDEELAGAGVLKIDVEGHELSALRGAESLLSGGRIRDIVFEQLRPPPTPVTRLLESHGYAVIGVRQALRGPIVSAASDAYGGSMWGLPALVATRDPGRAARRLEPRGWVCLAPRFHRRAISRR